MGGVDDMVDEAWKRRFQVWKVAIADMHSESACRQPEYRRLGGFFFVAVHYAVGEFVTSDLGFVPHATPLR